MFLKDGRIMTDGWKHRFCSHSLFEAIATFYEDYSPGEAALKVAHNRGRALQVSCHARWDSLLQLLIEENSDPKN
jgi:hypothetical protein